MFKRASLVSARVLVAGGLACALVAVAGVAHAQSEDRIKAAFLFNFARYVEWPDAAFASAAAPIRICVADALDFAGVAADAVDGKSVGDRPVDLVAITGLEGAAACHILYLGEALAADPAAVVASVASGHVFTVADRPGFAAEGGVANFMREAKRVRFEINPGVARAADLRISSRLLRLAKVVD